ncbi:MAG: alpha/beta hydrolase [Chitinophagales bacterium]
MQSLSSLAVKTYFKWQRHKRGGKHYPIQVVRKYFEQQARRLPSVKNLKVETEKTDIKGIPSTWFTPKPIPSKPLANHIIYYLHGGGYAICSVNTHQRLIAHIAKACHAKVLAIDYRLAPEHPFPAAIEDAISVYQHLLQSYRPSQIILMGDSAGGGLSAASLLKMKQLQIPLPKAAVLLSPWVDLVGENESYHTKADKDLIIAVADIRRYSKDYFKNTAPTHPLVSPVYADLSGLPPLLIQVGTHEVLIDDSLKLAEKAKQDGVDVTLQIWENMLHVWQFFADFMPESKKAIRNIAEFIEHL